MYRHLLNSRLVVMTALAYTRRYGYFPYVKNMIYPLYVP